MQSWSIDLWFSDDGIVHYARARTARSVARALFENGCTPRLGYIETGSFV